MIKTNSKRILPSAFWLLITLLSATMLIRGIWAMTQPWGMIYQKVFAWFFFFVCFLFSFYRLIASRTSSESQWASEKIQNLMYGIVSITFGVGGIFILLIGESKDRPWAIAAILFCGACGVFCYWRFKK
jgi:hypothetical protein